MRYKSAFVAVVALGGCVGSVDDETTAEDWGEGAEELFGCVSESRIAPFVQASARLNFADGGFCSGTLVAPNQILSAAHCFCGATTGTVSFAGSDGNVPAGAITWPIASFATPANANNCVSDPDDWATLSEDDPSYHQPYDIALVTIGPNAFGTFPAVTPASMYLADPDRAIDNQILVNNAWAVGYGTNAPAPYVAGTTNCPGCSVRRSGPIGQLEYGADPCDYLGPVPLEEDCYLSPLWFARSISEGNFSEPSLGDSGGGLFTNIELGCTNSNQGTSTAGILVGALSGWHEAEDTRARWAPLYHQRKFICDGLNVPAARTVAQARADGIYAIGTISLNDRARVLAEPTGAIGAPVSAGGNVNVGADVLVGAVNAGAEVWLRERARVQNAVRATGDITVQNGVTMGSQAAGTCTKLEPFSIAAPFSPGTENRTIENIRGPAMADYSLSPSDNVQDLTVRARVRLTLAAGLYVFRNFDLEAGAILKVPANTWIYITGTGEQRIRGDIDASANNIFFGIPNANSVLLGGEYRGAMVAPNAHVVGDMRDMAMLSGNFFVNHFTLHQGRWLFAVPFTGPWVPTCAPDRTNCQ